MEVRELASKTALGKKSASKNPLRGECRCTAPKVFRSPKKIASTERSGA